MPSRMITAEGEMTANASHKKSGAPEDRAPPAYGANIEPSSADDNHDGVSMVSIEGVVVLLLHCSLIWVVHGFLVVRKSFPEHQRWNYSQRSSIRWIQQHKVVAPHATKTQGDEDDLTTGSVGLYVHIPYCRRRCRYCNFAIVPVGDPMASPLDRTKQGFLDMDVAYREAVLKELSLVKKHTRPKTNKVVLRSIYFGGGTPSLAPIDTLRLMMEAILHPEESVFSLEANAEVTIEIDPGTFSLDKLKSLKDIGFNRLSLGVQSFDDGILESIGRVHRFQDIMESLLMIEQVFGPDVNYSMDLISGLPGLSLAKWAETLEIATSKMTPKPSHLSLYDLQIESGTVFGTWYDDESGNLQEQSSIGRTRGSMPVETSSPPLLPTADACAFMYKYAPGYLRSKGYEHYEISSYAACSGEGCAMPSKRSSHNQIYWETDSQWYALGLGATSSISGNLFARPRTMSEYLSWVEAQEHKAVSDWMNNSSGDAHLDDDYLSDVIMTRLRTSDGLNLDWLCENSSDGPDKVASVLQGLSLALELGLAEHVQTGKSHGTVRLVDPEGFLYSNSIISSIFVELDMRPS